MELKQTGIHNLNKNMLRKIEESKPLKCRVYMCKMGEEYLRLGREVQHGGRPRKHLHPSSSVACVAWKKYCLRPSKVFIDGKRPNVLQEGWRWVSCRLFAFVLF